MDQRNRFQMPKTFPKPNREYLKLNIEPNNNDDIDELFGKTTIAGLKIQLSKKNIPFYYTNQKGETLLHKILRMSSSNINMPEEKIHAFIKYCLLKGTPVDLHDDNGITPLHLAAKNQYYKIVKLLLDNGADIMSVDLQNMNVAHYAVQGKIIEESLKKREKNSFDNKQKNEQIMEKYIIENLHSNNSFIEKIKKYFENIGQIYNEEINDIFIKMIEKFGDILKENIIDDEKIQILQKIKENSIKDLIKKIETKYGKLSLGDLPINVSDILKSEQIQTGGNKNISILDTHLQNTIITYSKDLENIDLTTNKNLEKLKIEIEQHIETMTNDFSSLEISETIYDIYNKSTLDFYKKFISGEKCDFQAKNLECSKFKYFKKNIPLLNLTNSNNLLKNLTYSPYISKNYEFVRNGSDIDVLSKIKMYMKIVLYIINECIDYNESNNEGNNGNDGEFDDMESNSSFRSNMSGGRPPDAPSDHSSSDDEEDEDEEEDDEDEDDEEEDNEIIPRTTPSPTIPSPTTQENVPEFEHQEDANAKEEKITKHNIFKILMNFCSFGQKNNKKQKVVNNFIKILDEKVERYKNADVNNKITYITFLFSIFFELYYIFLILTNIKKNNNLKVSTDLKNKLDILKKYGIHFDKTPIDLFKTSNESFLKRSKNVNEYDFIKNVFIMHFHIIALNKNKNESTQLFDMLTNFIKKNDDLIKKHLKFDNEKYTDDMYGLEYIINEKNIRLLKKVEILFRYKINNDKVTTKNLIQSLNELNNSSEQTVLTTCFNNDDIENVFNYFFNYDPIDPIDPNVENTIYGKFYAYFLSLSEKISHDISFEQKTRIMPTDIFYANIFYKFSNDENIYDHDDNFLKNKFALLCYCVCYIVLKNRKIIDEQDRKKLLIQCIMRSICLYLSNILTESCPLNNSLDLTLDSDGLFDKLITILNSKEFNGTIIDFENIIKDLYPNEEIIKECDYFKDFSFEEFIIEIYTGENNEFIKEILIIFEKSSFLVNKLKNKILIFDRLIYILNIINNKIKIFNIDLATIGKCCDKEKYEKILTLYYYIVDISHLLSELSAETNEIEKILSLGNKIYYENIQKKIQQSKQKISLIYSTFRQIIQIFNDKINLLNQYATFHFLKKNMNTYFDDKIKTINKNIYTNKLFPLKQMQNDMYDFSKMTIDYDTVGSKTQLLKLLTNLYSQYFVFVDNKTINCYLSDKTVNASSGYLISIFNTKEYPNTDIILKELENMNKQTGGGLIHDMLSTNGIVGNFAEINFETITEPIYSLADNVIGDIYICDCKNNALKSITFDNSLINILLNNVSKKIDMNIPFIKDVIEIQFYKKVNKILITFIKNVIHNSCVKIINKLLKERNTDIKINDTLLLSDIKYKFDLSRNFYEIDKDLEDFVENSLKKYTKKDVIKSIIYEPSLFNFFKENNIINYFHVNNQIIDLFMDEGCKFDSDDYSGISPLFYSIDALDVETIEKIMTNDNGNYFKSGKMLTPFDFCYEMFIEFIESNFNTKVNTKPNINILPSISKKIINNFKTEHYLEKTLEYFNDEQIDFGFPNNFDIIYDMLISMYNHQFYFYAKSLYFSKENFNKINVLFSKNKFEITNPCFEIPIVNLFGKQISYKKIYANDVHIKLIQKDIENLLLQKNTLLSYNKTHNTKEIDKKIDNLQTELSILTKNQTDFENLKVNINQKTQIEDNLKISEIYRTFFIKILNENDNKYDKLWKMYINEIKNSNKMNLSNILNCMMTFGYNYKIVTKEDTKQMNDIYENLVVKHLLLLQQNELKYNSNNYVFTDIIDIMTHILKHVICLKLYNSIMQLFIQDMQNRISNIVDCDNLIKELKHSDANKQMKHYLSNILPFDAVMYFGKFDASSLNFKENMYDSIMSYVNQHSYVMETAEEKSDRIKYLSNHYYFIMEQTTQYMFEVLNDYNCQLMNYHKHINMLLLLSN